MCLLPSSAQAPMNATSIADLTELRRYARVAGVLMLLSIILIDSLIRLSLVSGCFAMCIQTMN